MFLRKNTVRILTVSALSLALISAFLFILPQKAVRADDSGFTYEFTENDLSTDPAAGINNKIADLKDQATAANPITFKLPAGKTYGLKSSIKLYSYMTLDLNGSTLKMFDSDNVQSPAHNMIRFGTEEFGEIVTGYAYKNITIKNGTIDGNEKGATLLKLAHGKDITLSGLTVCNTRDYHLCEFAAIDGLTVDNCTFKDQVLTDDDETTYEAIQLDVLAPAHFESYEFQSLPMKNVTINECTFNNVPRAIGSHTAILNDPFENITITNNTINKCSSAAIQGNYWKDVTITGNTITDAPRGIVVYSVNGNGGESSAANGTYLSTTIDTNLIDPDYHGASPEYKTPFNANIKISNNKITLNNKEDYSGYNHVGILTGGVIYDDQTLYTEDSSGRIPEGDYYIDGVTIKDNDITTSGHGIRLANTKNANVSNNSIDGSIGIGDPEGDDDSSISYHGISAVYHSESITISSNNINESVKDGIIASISNDIKIKNNTIDSPRGYGIRGTNSSTITALSGNKITDSYDNGIMLSVETNCSCSIKENKISNSGRDGIVVSDSYCNDITDNEIINPSEEGIVVSSGICSQDITGNKISNAGSHGIQIISGSSAKSVTDNEINGVAGYGIHLTSDSTSCGAVSGNTIDGAKSGIMVTNKAYVSGSISNNTITGPEEHGIKISDSGTKGQDVTNNTIENAGTTGIMLNNGAKLTGNIESNTITTTGKYGIIVSDSGTSCTDVKSNTISGTASTGILAAKSVSVASISSNNISNAGETGIKVSESSKVKTISNNTVASSAGNGIAVSTGSKVSGGITSNTISSSKENGIKIANDSTVVSKIDSNKITDSTLNGIMVNNQGQVSGAVTGNTINGTKKYGIQVCDSGSVGSVTDNKISNIKGDHGIAISSATSGKISGNEISSPVKTGILVSTGAKITGAITDNKINTPGDCGIKVTGSSSTCTDITSNTITKSAGNGIVLSDSAKASGNIKSNSITSAGDAGIKVCDKSSCASISFNTVKGTKTNGIVVSGGAKVSKDIADNNINSAGSNGIKISDANTSVDNITSNKVTASTEYGIMVSASAKVTGSVSQNTVDGAKKSGIMVYDKANVPVITKNIINGSGDCGIKINGASATCKDITDNQILKSGYIGILLSDKAKVTGNITGNLIEDPKDAGIKVCATASANNISSNRVFYAGGDYAVMVSSGGSVVTLKDNIIVFPTDKANAIKVDSQSTVKVNLDNNVYKFEDVTNKSDFWFVPTYALASKGVVKGYDNEKTFRPTTECTRGQMVTFLWRLSGCPNPQSNKCNFIDVKKTDYYYKAVIWGSEQGIVEGYKDGTFGPKIVCMRKHAVTFMWRMAGKPKPKSKKNKFSDVKTSNYFYQATIWASENNILAGYADGTFKPDGKCLRRQMVTFLYKYDVNINGSK